MSQSESIEDQLRQLLKAPVTKSVQNLIDISAVFDQNYEGDVFTAIAQLEPALAARIQIVTHYEESFMHSFRYPYSKSADLARECVRYNNGRLLILLQNVSAVPQEYRVEFYERHLHSREAVLALREQMLHYLYEHDSVNIVNVHVTHFDYTLLLDCAVVPHPQLLQMEEYTPPSAVIGDFNLLLLYVKQTLQYYKERRSGEDLRFWVGTDYAELNSVHIWSMYKLSYLKPYRDKRDSYPFLFTYPQELYSSLRPKTDMQIFHLPGPPGVVPQADYLPVVRYATSMSGSLFFGEQRPQDVCGRFYYHEPESQTFLRYRRGRILRGFNKVDIYHKTYAAVQAKNSHLARKMHKEYLRVIAQPEGRRVELHREGALRKDLKYTAYEAYTLFDVEYADGSQDIPPRDGTLQTDAGHFYVANQLGLYAAEDELDQALCMAARFLDYDVVFLETMVGAYQVVSEVLDVRDDSFSYLEFRS